MVTHAHTTNNIKQSFEASTRPFATHATLSRPGALALSEQVSPSEPHPVDRCFPLEQAKEGHDYLEAGKSRGKVLYEI